MNSINLQNYGLFFVMLMSVSFFSCKNSSTESPNAPVSFYGEDFDTVGMISYASLLAQMGDQDSIYAKVYGKVEAVCQTKGCWMDIVPSDGQSVDQELFVQFKDYAFFMPKDFAGKSVAVQGYAYREKTSVEDLKHYAEDEGLSQEEIDAITEPEVQVKFMASGVKVLDN